MADDNRKVVIELQNVKRYFQVGSETVKALRGVSFKIYEGEFARPTANKAVDAKTINFFFIVLI